MADFPIIFFVLENELTDEINKLRTKTLLDHLRLCGNIPES